MLQRIGLLLPRSTDYPTLGYDILDGVRSCLGKRGNDTVSFFTENIGFGEDDALNYAKAEKLLLQDNAEVIIAYCNATNAEPLYLLAETLARPFIFLDAGMLLASCEPSAHCYTISLQGIHACRFAGQMAGQNARSVLMATSFYDGGYRGPWSYDRGISEAGGTVSGNFISGYKVAEFTIAPFLDLLQHAGAQAVGACFSSYLAQLFFSALASNKQGASPLPFYCSPYMAEEQLLHRCEFPGGDFFAVVPWGSSLPGREQEEFKQAIQKEKNKPANLFHLLGWEAAVVADKATNTGVASLASFSYDSPRGKVSFHPETQVTYAPLYAGRITSDSEGKCALIITTSLPVTQEEHEAIFRDRPQGIVSGWRNNYLCI